MLFTPLQLRGITLKNRIVLSPMLQYCATNGRVNDWHLMHYGKFAAGGAGLVFVESTKVDPMSCASTLTGWRSAPITSWESNRQPGSAASRRLTRTAV